MIIFDEYLLGWALKEFSFIEPYLTVGYIISFLSFGILLLTDKMIIDQRSTTFAIINISQFFFRIILTISLIVVFGYKLWGVYGAMVAEVVIATIIATYYLRKFYSFNSFNISKLREYSAYALPLIPHGLSFSLLNIGDRIIMQHYLPLQSVGIYHIGYQIGFGFFLLSKGFSRAFYPHIMKTLRQSDNTGNYNDYKDHLLNKVIPVILSIGIIINLLYLTWTKELLQILVRNTIFLQANKVISIILAAMFFSFMQSLFIPILQYQKNSKEISFSTVISVLISIILNILLIPVYGIIGAAIASLTAYIIRFLIIFYIISYKQVNKILIIRYFAPLALLIFYYFIYNTFSTNNDYGFHLTVLLWKVPLSLLFVFISYRMWKSLQEETNWLRSL